MQELLDSWTQIVSLLVPIAAILGFVFRKWVGQRIEAHFRHKVEIEIEREKSRLSLHLETLKNDLLKQFEDHKRKSDENARVAFRVIEQRIAAYEVFSLGHGRVIGRLHTLKFLDKDYTEMTATTREAHRMETFHILRAAQEKFGEHEMYLPVDIGGRVATLYRDLMAYLAEGARNDDILDKLAREESLIFAELRTMLLGDVP